MLGSHSRVDVASLMKDIVKSKARSRKWIKQFGCHLDVNVIRLRVYSKKGWRVEWMCRADSGGNLKPG